VSEKFNVIGLPPPSHRERHYKNKITVRHLDFHDDARWPATIRDSDRCSICYCCCDIIIRRKIARRKIVKIRMEIARTQLQVAFVLAVQGSLTSHTHTPNTTLIHVHDARSRSRRSTERARTHLFPFGFVRAQ